MPIKAQSAKRQVLRFQGLPFWDTKHTELESAYQEAFETDHDAEEFTRELLRIAHDCPVPADVWTAASAFAAKKREQELRTGFKCEICKDLRFVSVGPNLSKRCVCNPETEESSLRGHYVRPKPVGEHPEVALGIPAVVITAKPAFKAIYAARCSYQGPLTLAEAVEKGVIDRERAVGLVRYWMQEGGDHVAGEAMIASVTPGAVSKPPARQQGRRKARVAQ
jgi:hypothetical protein